MKNLYIIEYECAHWCGGSSNVVVWAYSPEHAEELAEMFMDESMRELYSDEYAEDEEECQEQAHTVNSIELLDVNHDCWKFFLDPSQSDFYPVLGDPH